MNARLPLLLVPSAQMTDILLTDLPTADVYLFIMDRLRELGEAHFHLYTHRHDRQPTMVFVWKDDTPRLSKHLRERLLPVKVKGE